MVAVAEPPLTVQEAAHWLKTSTSTIYEMCSTGRLKSFRIGTGRGSIRINKNALLLLEQEGNVEQQTTYEVMQQRFEELCR